MGVGNFLGITLKTTHVTLWTILVHFVTCAESLWKAEHYHKGQINLAEKISREHRVWAVA